MESRSFHCRTLLFWLAIASLGFGYNPELAQIYYYNFGACVSACVNRGEERAKCNDRCWQIWKIFLQEDYRLINHALQKIEKEGEGNGTTP
jgi:hypothetical protein